MPEIIELVVMASMIFSANLKFCFVGASNFFFKKMFIMQIIIIKKHEPILERTI